LPTGGRGSVDTLFATGRQREHEFLSFEFPSNGGEQTMRMGDWTGMRQNPPENPGSPKEGDNLATDIGEHHEVAASQPDIVRRIRELMKSSPTPSKQFPCAALDGK
jgi:hypothetical protein